MSHPSFERMLFERQDLTLAEHRELQAHLQDCAECRSLDTGWREADQTLRNAQSISPSPGFSARFSERLTREKRKSIVRHHFYATSFTAIALVVVSLFGVYQLVEVGLYEANTILKVVISFIRITGYLELVGGFISLILEETIGRIPLPYWLLTSTALSGLFLIWSASIYRFSLLSIPIRNSKGVGK